MSIWELINDSWEHGKIDELVGLFILSIALVGCGFILIMAVLKTFTDYDED